MRLLIRSFILISFFQIASYAMPSNQKISELEFITSSNPIYSETMHKKNSFSEPGIFKLKNLFIATVRFYQLFISTQDIPVCNFTPSCSQFGIEAIGKFGVIRGILLTSDRLQRCNSMSISRYQIDHVTGKLIDPVNMYIDLK